jgi:hypothetical protein
LPKRNKVGDRFIATALSKTKVKNVKKSIKGTQGSLSIDHQGSTDELIEHFTKIPALEYAIAELEEGKVKIAMQ